MDACELDLLRCQVVALQDAIAGYKATLQSLRSRLAELENREDKVPRSLVDCEASK